MAKKYTVLYDTREQKPFRFTADSKCNGSIQQSLPTGDYTLLDCEDLLVIERKLSVAELATNVGKEKDRFERLCERMSHHKFKYFLFEFSEEDVAKYPIGSGLPKRVMRRIRIRGKYILKCLNRYHDEYGIDIIFAGNRDNAKKEAKKIFEEVYKYAENRKLSD